MLHGGVYCTPVGTIPNASSEMTYRTGYSSSGLGLATATTSAAFLPHCEQRSRGAKALSVVDGDSVGGDVSAVIRTRAKLEPADANVARHQILSALHLGHFAATLPAVGRDTR